MWYIHTHTHTHTHTHIHTMECYSAIKKNEILTSATTWMDQRALCLSEVSQTKTQYDLTYMWNLKTKPETNALSSEIQRTDWWVSEAGVGQAKEGL